MSAPTIPLPGEAIAVIRNSNDLVEALRKMKDLHALSNTWCDETGGLTSGHTDKALGPTRSKMLSPMLFDLFAEMFAVEFHMVINLEAVKRMEKRWEKREGCRVAFPEWRISKKLVDKAKPYVLRDFSAVGNAARTAMLPAKHRSDIARKAAKSRWRKHRRARRKPQPTPEIPQEHVVR